jgi:hypothetical protein
MHRYGYGFSGCMFGVACLSRFVEPGNWAAWTVLALLAVAFGCLGVVGHAMRNWE